MRLPYSFLALVLVVLVCARAAHYVYVGYIKAPRMIKGWKARGNMDAVAKWEKIQIDYRRKYIPITVGAALLCLIGFGGIELGHYLENYFALHSPLLPNP